MSSPPSPAATAAPQPRESVNTQLPNTLLPPFSDSSIPGEVSKPHAVRDGSLDAVLEDAPPHSTRHNSTGRSLKLSPEQLRELISSPNSLPMRSLSTQSNAVSPGTLSPSSSDDGTQQTFAQVAASPMKSPGAQDVHNINARPSGNPRSASMPLISRKQTTSKSAKAKPQLSPLRTDDASTIPQSGVSRSSARTPQQRSPSFVSLPLPPLSLPTYLHLELASERPSALYLHRSSECDVPFESSKVKFQRLLNFFLLPPNLEQVLWFGALACLDTWLYTFTILPLRFLNALGIILQWCCRFVISEISGLAAMSLRCLNTFSRRQHHNGPCQVPQHHKSAQPDRDQAYSNGSEAVSVGAIHHRTSPLPTPKARKSMTRRKSSRSTPSKLLAAHKADLLQGLLIIFSCVILMWFDASRMYHSIRGQAAIKLYVIYNVLEVFDRLFSAIGQDVLECLFSKETLERDSHGRSKILRPLWMFALALAYNVIHATALFYQVVTLNVAVNSYSNALLTLLMSNQFVEIKGTVFKKFEKENLFQLTCADIVERFQLWLMLLIIALRNIVEVGGLSVSSVQILANDPTGPSLSSSNASGVPLVSGYVIPKSFTLFPKWTGEVLGPFLIVLGSEALVDWCKHAYILKFNNVKPNIYGRFLDVLAKDYYSHAFVDQNLTKRLGLPVVPLSCLFIRACVQTYHMIMANTASPHISSTTSLSVESPLSSHSSFTTAASQYVSYILRRAAGQSGNLDVPSSPWITHMALDDLIALVTIIIFSVGMYLVLLSFKLLLGMVLLSFARNRYRDMKTREHQGSDMQGKRVGGWGSVEVNEDKRQWIYHDDPEGLREVRDKEARGRAKVEKGELKLDHVDRYTMAAKRIW